MYSLNIKQGATQFITTATSRRLLPRMETSKQAALLKIKKHSQKLRPCLDG
jgi:hypothetical protein